MNSILIQKYWDNTIYDYAIACGIILLSFVAIRIFRLLILRRLGAIAVKSKTTWDDFLVELIKKSVVPSLYVVSVYLTITSLSLSPKVRTVLHALFIIAITFFVIRIISSAFKKFVYSFIKRQENGELKEKQASGLILIVNCVIWVMGIVFLIDNMGYNVTTIVAGLGIGGIAIALAAQAILGDLFSYFVIFFDRPFEIGDFIVIDDKAGIVEYIGLKTTRIKTLNGEQLVCSNTDLTNSRLHNYKRLQKRRVVFSLGVTYQTPHEVLSAIPGLVKEIIQSKELVEYDRGHFSGYGDFSLNFEFVYFVADSEYNVYMDKQQAIFLDIFSAFERKGIEFAYPTQTLYIQPDNSFSPKVSPS